MIRFDDILEKPGVVFAALFVKPGDVIRQVTHSALRPGCIIAEAETREELMKRTDEYAGQLARKIILN